MAEQALLDYIKKARQAQQSDDQSRALLYKNGWTEAEVSEALSILGSSLSQQEIQPRPQTQPAQAQPVQAQRPQFQPVNQAQPIQIQRPQPEPSFQANILRNNPTPSTAKPIYNPAAANSAAAMKKPTDLGRPKSHFLPKLATVIVILVVLAGIYFTAGQYVSLPYSNLLWNFFSPNTQTIIDKMAENMKAVKALHSVAQIEIGDLRINFNGEFDSFDANNPKGDGNITTNSGSISFAFVNKTAYIKLNDFTGSEQYLPSAGLDKAKTIGKWFKIDENSVKTISQAQPQEISSMANIQTVQKLQNLLTTEGLLANARQLNSQIISGQDTYHYSATIGRDKIRNILAKMEVPAGYISSIADAIGDTNLELWIGKEDFMLYRLKTKNLDMTNSGFNKPITVPEPQGAQKFEDLIAPMLKVSKIRQDMAIIGSAAGIIYAETQKYLLLCAPNGYIKAPKGASQSPALISAVSDIIKQGGSNPACMSASQDFCISTKLPDGTYLCVGKSGSLGATQCLTYQTECK